MSCTAAILRLASLLHSSAGFSKLSHLTEKVSRKLFLEDSLLGDKVKQILALTPLHHDEEAVVRLADVEDADDVGVAQSRADPKT